MVERLTNGSPRGFSTKACGERSCCLPGRSLSFSSPHRAWREVTLRMSGKSRRLGTWGSMYSDPGTPGRFPKDWKLSFRVCGEYSDMWEENSRFCPTEIFGSGCSVSGSKSCYILPKSVQLRRRGKKYVLWIFLDILCVVFYSSAWPPSPLRWRQCYHRHKLVTKAEEGSGVLFWFRFQGKRGFTLHVQCWNVLTLWPGFQRRQEVHGQERYFIPLKVSSGR